MENSFLVLKVYSPLTITHPETLQPAIQNYLWPDPQFVSSSGESSLSRWTYNFLHTSPTTHKPTDIKRLNQGPEKYLCSFTNNNWFNWVSPPRLAMFVYKNVDQAPTFCNPFYTKCSVHPNFHSLSQKYPVLLIAITLVQHLHGFHGELKSPDLAEVPQQLIQPGDILFCPWWQSSALHMEISLHQALQKFSQKWQGPFEFHMPVRPPTLKLGLSEFSKAQPGFHMYPLKHNDVKPPLSHSASPVTIQLLEEFDMWETLNSKFTEVTA